MIKKQAQHWHPGLSLVEVVLFIALVSIISIVAIPLLVQTYESHKRQKAIFEVETNAAQVMQVLTRDIRNAERILDPKLSETGAVLALQTDSLLTNPTLFSVGSGALYRIEGSDARALTSPTVTVSNFVATNTSTTKDRQSTRVSFVITYAYPAYTGSFLMTASLFPDDVVEGLSCVCSSPNCNTSSNQYEWGSCQSGSCVNHADFTCP